MSIETIRTDVIDKSFQRIWDENEITEHHAAATEGFAALEAQHNDPEAARGVVHLTDVTLRDGQQQRTAEVTKEQRTAVFDHIVETGVDRIEIGHLGNDIDQQLARDIVRKIAEKEQSDERYRHVKLQVLFGSQEELIKEGSAVLQHAFQEYYGDDWQKIMADKVVVHVYDRLDENLRNTSSTPYSDARSAERVAAAAQCAIDAGFTHFSISAEAATAEIPETAIQFYRSINEFLLQNGAESVNVNLANTYGYSQHETWDTATLAVFDTAVKYGFTGNVTTSIHMHNDVNNAIDFSMAALRAGFDRVEGTHTGMGERAGNVASTDIVARILEHAKHAIDDEEREPARRSRIARATGTSALRRTVQLDGRIVDNLSNWFETGSAISDTFGPHARYRWERTTIGNPYKFDNGSGPHDQAMAAAVRDPLTHPPYRNYEWFLALAHAMGAQEAEALAIGDPKAVETITVNNHASGGNTKRLVAGETVREVSDEAVEKARQRFIDYAGKIARRAAEGVTI